MVPLPPTEWTRRDNHEIAVAERISTVESMRSIFKVLWKDTSCSLSPRRMAVKAKKVMVQSAVRQERVRRQQPPHSTGPAAAAAAAGGRNCCRKASDNCSRSTWADEYLLSALPPPSQGGQNRQLQQRCPPRGSRSSTWHALVHAEQRGQAQVIERTTISHPALILPCSTCTANFLVIPCVLTGNASTLGGADCGRGCSLTSPAREPAEGAME